MTKKESLWYLSIMTIVITIKNVNDNNNDTSNNKYNTQKYYNAIKK